MIMIRILKNDFSRYTNLDSEVPLEREEVRSTNIELERVSSVCPNVMLTFLFLLYIL